MQEESVDLRKELDAIYTPLSVAKEEIWRRWNDKALRKKVEDFLGGDIPEVLKKSPRACLARSIASPNFETTHFLKLSKETGVEQLFLEYSKDKFVTKNFDKYYLGKMYFYGGSGKNGGSKLSALKVLNYKNNNDGKKMYELETVWGNNLADFHHQLLDSADNDYSLSRLDVSDFFKSVGLHAEEYYPYFLALFICHGVLFENYLLSNEQARFVRNVFLPNYKKVQNILGLKPLIVRLFSNEEEANIYWKYYPESMKNKINKR
ncbi:MAG: hypothetical protein WCK16_02545 [Candidatus Moraniibacteriota bacterium]